MVSMSSHSHRGGAYYLTSTTVPVLRIKTLCVADMSAVGPVYSVSAASKPCNQSGAERRGNSCTLHRFPSEPFPVHAPINTPTIRVLWIDEGHGMGMSRPAFRLKETLGGGGGHTDIH
jgi:hypothetical protein